MSNQHYQVIRENYLKLSKKEYLTITTSFFMLNIVLILILKTQYHPPDRTKGNVSENAVVTGDIIVYLSQITGAFIQPLVVYVSSGYFYYKASV
jgi:hypothetical protein